MNALTTTITIMEINNNQEQQIHMNKEAEFTQLKLSKNSMQFQKNKPKEMLKLSTKISS